MFQFECVGIQEIVGSSLVQVSFELLLNGESTNQRAAFMMQPDYCEVGDAFDITAKSFTESTQVVSRANEFSLN
jgi:hypothetical protein